MKKIFMFLMTSLALTSCSNDDAKEINSSNDLNARNSSTDVGEIHNVAMDNFKNNFDFRQRFDSDEVGINEIYRFNNSFLEQVTNHRYNEYSQDEKMYFFNTESLLNDSFQGRNSFYDRINELKDNGILTIVQANTLTNLLDLSKSNALGHINNNELNRSLVTLNAVFNERNENSSNTGYYLVKNSLDIAINSSEWWIENLPEDDLPEYTIYVAPWVAADVVGGIGSGFINIIEQGISNSQKPVDAKKLGYAMLKGAVMSSVAPWSRITKIIFR